VIPATINENSLPTANVYNHVLYKLFAITHFFHFIL